MRFFTSDTHFGHQRIIELCNRPYKDVNHMNEMMIFNWNSVVSPDDTVYHMGDVSLGTIADSLPLISRLNGIKILVPGNHDRIFSGESPAKRARWMPEYFNVFQVILAEQAFITLNDGRRYMLCHFPYVGDSQENDRHVDKRPIDTGLPLIHGHIHEKRRGEGNMLNVGVDVNSFTPVSEDEVVNYFHGVSW